MHPNAAFRQPDHFSIEAMVNHIGFGMVFAQTPDGPRVAHTPLLLTGELSKGDCKEIAIDIEAQTVTSRAGTNYPDILMEPLLYYW